MNPMLVEYELLPLWEHVLLMKADIRVRDIPHIIILMISLSIIV